MGRARIRWVLVLAVVLSLMLLFAVFGSEEDSSTRLGRLHTSASGLLGLNGKAGSRPGPAGIAPGGLSVDEALTQDIDPWVKGSGRTNLTYHSHFNQDDLTLCEDECDAFFPGLWKEIDRSVEFFTKKQQYNKEYLEFSCDDGIWTHARVVIYNNRMYLKYYQQSDFTRSQAALALLHLAVSTSRERLPNVEFCMGMMDWGSRGKFSLDRAPDLEDVWLMPDYGWWSWPEHVGSYQELREKTARVEKEVGWAKKINKLMWRGSMRVGTADRESLVAVARGHDWSDIKALDWGDPSTQVSMEDHCRWKFHGFPEGNTYSGRLRYLQNCRVVIVTHEPRWLQHWTHLYNGDWKSPDQNIVYVPKPQGEGQGVLVHDGDGKASYDRTWERLPETMDALLADDAHAKRIADNSWTFFRERYVTPASATCYWRKLLWGFSKVQKYQVDLSGSETSYESWILKGMKGTREYCMMTSRTCDDVLQS
ncbi:hypothetical protein IE81DRAFT_287417 [Ceraceosorus guamensis]|uniref:Glycosyl transferase CAP10 domain-containing protein n=1 Tax=Ceraceosorus guamensis TaxID=1522189 RepID=A0A316W5H5_9BASI|nr:hypothetical protein IE81DRAFT_287417 [Ceraceosorus guamensis]PWN44318.1 hypothetical protein IE81DRAFT_287417 [Ceraceosorus guamensis]